MAKFMVLYSSTISASDLMANATPEQISTSMDEWIKWREEASKTAHVEFGLPLQAASTISTDGVAASTSRISGYSIIDGASKEAIVELLKSHPHLNTPDASIDVLEMLPLPSM